MKNKIKNNKKGFTLIELLAVIVVLAIIMVLAVPNIINSMNNAKKKSFQMYAQKMLNSALNVYESNQLLSSGANPEDSISGHKVDGTDDFCYTFQDLGMTSNTGSYQGYVRIAYTTAVDSTGKNLTEYYVTLTDNTYYYNDTVSGSVNNDITSILLVNGEGNKTLAEVREDATKCVAKS